MLRRENPHPKERNVGISDLCVSIKGDSSNEPLRFERLISDLSAQFVNVDPDEIDGEIERALTRVLEFFQVERCGMLGISPDRKRVYVTHMACAEGIERVSGDIDLVNLFPWLHERVVSQGQPVRIERLEELPEADGQDRLTCTAMGILSFVNIPLFLEGKVSSLIFINAMRGERSWPEEYIPRLQLLGEIFINALARKRADRTLRESEERLSLAADAAHAMLWTLQSDTGHIWITEKGKEFFGFAPDCEIDRESFLKVVHPEDRESLRLTVEETLLSGKDNSAEYRIVRPDGSIRWVLARGRVYQASAGHPACLMGVSIDITESKQMDEQLKEQLNEIKVLKQRLEKENIYLREEVQLLAEHTDIVGRSVALKKVLSQAEQVAQTDSTILLLGETGTGKELLARAIHSMSKQKDRLMVTINCASLPPTLIESELFGREKGAYTGALTKMIGRFEIADGSTLFLDEIGELPFDLQSKLLRVIEEGTFERLGSTKPLHVNARIIAATNRDIEQEVKEGRFRRDLFYRLNVFPIVIPPLRERPEDIPLLVRAFVKEFQKRMGKEIESIPKKTIHALQSYFWPGNVRELRNVIEHAMILSRSKTLDVQVPEHAPIEKGATDNLNDVEQKHVVAVLEKTGWRISGQGGAAELLGLKRTTLHEKMKKLGISRRTMPMS